MPYKDPAKQRDWRKKYKEKEQEQSAKYYANRERHIYDSITTGNIIDQNTWDLWCNRIKRGAKRYKHPYSDDFTNDIMFEMMIQGCFYCGSVATTIDRVDSKLDHTPDNCVGSCLGCNKSKGVADSDTFKRKAYYRARGEYYDDDTDVWFVHKTKPRMCVFKRKGVPFELTKDDWEKLVVGECVYCHRSPTTWFGVDRIVPSLGYVLGNVASCCWDCNNDKAKDDVEQMRARNERIARRMDDGELVIDGHEKVILHMGTHPSSTPVCARGKVYENMLAASRALFMSPSYVINCIYYGICPDEIFIITKEFYEEYKDAENITKNMFYQYNIL